MPADKQTARKITPVPVASNFILSLSFCSIAAKQRWYADGFFALTLRFCAAQIALDSTAPLASISHSSKRRNNLPLPTLFCVPPLSSQPNANAAVTEKIRKIRLINRLYQPLISLSRLLRKRGRAESSCRGEHKDKMTSAAKRLLELETESVTVMLNLFQCLFCILCPACVIPGQARDNRLPHRDGNTRCRSRVRDRRGADRRSCEARMKPRRARPAAKRQGTPNMTRAAAAISKLKQWIFSANFI